MKLSKLAPAALALATALPSPAQAQSRIDERRPAAAEGVVEIENAAGHVRVIGWNRDEIRVRGTLGGGAQGLDFVSGQRRARIEVDVHGNPNRVTSDLEVHVPAGSRLTIDSYSAAIDVRDVSGHVRAESVSGAISISGSAGEVEAESVSGAISITGPAQRVRASGVNGGVTIRGVSGVVEADSVNGSLEVSGGAFRDARLETVNGALRFDGDLVRGATLDVETVNGSVELRLPADVGAHFTISSFGGDIDSDFDVTLRSERARAERERRRDRREHEEHEPGREWRFTTGGGGAQVSITTLNGRIALRKK